MVAALFLTLIGAAPPAFVDRRPPIDQCSSDRSFVLFREALRAAVARRDAEYVLGALADDILVDFGGSVGRQAFIEAWELDRPESSRLWDELAEVLRLGCGEGEDGLLLAPSLWVQMDDHPDPSSVVLATRPGAVLRSAPDPNAPAVAELEWDMLTLRPHSSRDEWHAVSLADGRTGFVHHEEVRSLLDYRAAFRRSDDGQWRMVFFVAGD